LLASRQVGKSTGIACLIWHLLAQGQFAVLIAPSERQSKELFRKIVDFKNRSHITAVRSTQTELELSNGGQLVCTPSSSDTIRGYSSVDLPYLRRSGVHERGRDHRRPADARRKRAHLDVQHAERGAGHVL
jgi:hypothetical protein